MTVAFIIAEYNPFHNGHAYHIAKTKDELKTDAIVCIMSGHFTQRGSAAIIDKWSRARMALRGGADLVLELHPVYACFSAETFARGAMMTADLLGIGGWLSFGTENANLPVLTRLANIMNDEPASFKKLLGEALACGKSYAAARQIALTECYIMSLDDGPNSDLLTTRKELDTILKGANNILAIEYIRAINHFGLQFSPYPVSRAISRHDTCNNRPDAEYTDADNNNPPLYLSASEIRDNFRKYNNSDNYHSPLINTFPNLLMSMPDFSRALLEAEFSLGRGPVFDESFFPLIITMLRREGAEALRGFKDINEGLENRIYNAALHASCYDEIVETAATRRYPKSRVRRILTRFLLGFDNATLDAIDTDNAPPYLRVLGFTDLGRKLLARCKSGTPIITNHRNLARAGVRGRDFMRLEARATDIYAMAYQNAEFRTAGQEYIRKVVRFNSEGRPD